MPVYANTAIIVIMAKKKTAIDNQHELLAKELKSLIPKLDSEGLAFLVEQARVHIYNMQVDELNKAAVAANAASVKAASLARGNTNHTAKKSGSAISIKGTESGSSYYLHCKNNDVMFSKDEMIRLVKIVNGEGTDLEIRERLYNWFDRERKDVFAVVSMKDKFDNNLKTLASVLKKTFKLRN